MSDFKTQLQARQPSSTGNDALWAYGGIAATMALVVIADYFTPLGTAVWVFYFLPVAMSLWTWRPAAPLVVAGMSVAWMVVGFLTDEAGVDRSVALLNRSFASVSILVMAGIGYYFIRNKIAVRREEWLQSGQTRLSEALAGEQRLDELGGNLLKFLANYLDAQAGAFYTKNGSGLVRVATFGVPAGGAPEQINSGDGLVWQAFHDNAPFVLSDVPENYLTIGSALGNARPRQLLIAPVDVDNAANGVIELGFLQPVDATTSQLLARVADSIGVAVRSADYRTHLQNLLHETQQQAEELQVQSEELRVANEELEEQSRALQESQARLENQQVELEQTNVQLEEQAQMLESQRDDIAHAHASLDLKARQLDQASRYKSDFLANMSHELRTPLNSALILARLLADNPEGNLSDEQVSYSETILNSGNDLLALINDILDLSKIEAGRMEIKPETLPLAHVLDDLERTFRPLAEDKGLSLRLGLQDDCPPTIETDRQRLEQVLKNLLSNAIKFTDRGEVSLTAGPAHDGQIALAVQDTGVGIDPEHQELVFEAFRQADGASNRKHGGTGLGLSISRQLTRLLGGEITLDSRPGTGSTFTVTIPRVYDPARVPTPAILSTTPAATPSLPSATDAPAARPMRHKAVLHRVPDDRERLTGNSRVILIVEDDESFAKILSDLAHELNFECLVATTAEEALAVAAQHIPNAVLLDVGLPDQSGLSVLDRLKHDARTRHIPVHVVSASDYSQKAMTLGAVGYMLKPVKREDLIATLKGLETRFTQRMRRVLIVEDDTVQLDSMRKLLGSREVETVGVGSAADCLQQLKTTTFDCMVLDLSLPDATGYELLETLSREDAYSFPPVIVYTGRDLSADEEQRLRRYSKSIIIKGAKSPERLLDEVTLFLHQVVAELPPEHQKMIKRARSRDAALEGRRILIVEDDVRNVFALTSILEPRGAILQIARNGREALQALEKSLQDGDGRIDLVLMDVMMPEMDGLTATREIRSRAEWKKLPILILTAKAMKDDQENCLAAGASDYMAKPLDVEKLLSLVRVWMPR